MNLNMKNRYRTFRRGWGVYYCEDTQTGKQESAGPFRAACRCWPRNGTSDGDSSRGDEVAEKADKRSGVGGAQP
jgi:hypothetical protein